MGRLLRGFADHGIPSHQRRRNLPREDRQREVPGGDTDKRPAPSEVIEIILPRRPGQLLALWRKERTPLRGVIAAKINGFADFALRIGQGFAGFFHAKHH